MRKYSLFLVLWLACSLPFGLHAEVILTDEQAKELDETITQLEKVLTEQAETITSLEKRNKELETQSENKQQILNEQDETMNEVRSSSTRLGIFSVLRNILTAIISFTVGALIGFLL